MNAYGVSPQDAKLRGFRERANRSIELQKSKWAIESQEDYKEWRNTFAPPRLREIRKRRYGEDPAPGTTEDGKKINFHEFKRLPDTLDPKKFKEKVGFLDILLYCLVKVNCTLYYLLPGDQVGGQPPNQAGAPEAQGGAILFDTLGWMGMTPSIKPNLLEKERNLSDKQNFTFI